MLRSWFIYLFIVKYVYSDISNSLRDTTKDDVIAVKHFITWPNASVPFFINPQHYDREQSMTIMTALSLFAFKTCLKFAPVMTAPQGDEHVLVIENPDGLRKCSLDTEGHSIDGPHRIVLGYDCLQSPQIDMMIMRTLGFPFEHNRASRDFFVDIQIENVEPSAIDLFAKDQKLPLELRSLPYDINSVLHFGDRDFSKNGHRTIMFKDRKAQQNRIGLSSTDLRKIEIVYGPECLKRDRQEKIELCQNYPGVVRRKRDTESEAKSLRVNPNITPPPNGTNEVEKTLKDLGIEDDVQKVVDEVHKVSSKALKNARTKYCNDTKQALRTEEKIDKIKTADIVGVIEIVADYARSMVEHALTNLTAFCETSNNMDEYVRARCPFYGAPDCPRTYKSTKSGPVRYSTQHRPTYHPPTKHEGRELNRQYIHYGRAGNATEEISTTESSRKKRDADKKSDLRMGTTIRADKRIAYGDRRYFEERRFRVKKRPENWDRSAISLEDRKEKNTQKRHRIKKRKPNRMEGERGHKKREMQEREAQQESEERPERGEGQLEIEEIDEGRQEREKRPQESKEGRQERKKRPQERGKGRQERGKGRQERGKKPQKSEDGRPKRGEGRQEREHREQKGREKHNKKDRERIPKRQVKRRPRNGPRTVPLSKINKEFYNERKWPEGVVRYLIKDDGTFDIEDLRHRLEEVNSILKKETCVRLQEITQDETETYEDYLVLDTSPDYVTGRVGGRQNFGCVELLRGGQHKQHTAMMVMAMLGFYFELARHDRDKYVRVHLRHVRPDKLHHFEKIREDATLPLPYDYKSATHPAWQFWRIIGKTGISTVATYKEQDPNGSVMRSLGQNSKLLSDLDIVKINSVYGIKCLERNQRVKTDEKLNEAQ